MEKRIHNKHIDIMYNAVQGNDTIQSKTEWTTDRFRNDCSIPIQDAPNTCTHTYTHAHRNVC